MTNAMKVFLLCLTMVCCIRMVGAQQVMETELLVVGGTTGGIAAAIQAARMGVKTIIVEQTPWLGGMLTAAGVSCTDGNHTLHSGIWQEFREALYKNYKTRNLFAGWVSETCFEPHVGDSIFKAWVASLPNLQVQYQWYFDHAISSANTVTGVVFVNARGATLTIRAKRTIDATDLGDVLASAGAGFDVGTEDSLQSGESIAPGKTNIIQDMTWAATLQDFGKGSNHTIPRPAGYDSTRYFCSTSDAPCKLQPYNGSTQKVLNYGKLRTTNGITKYMLNWPAHGNDFYLNVIDLTPRQRDSAYQQAKNQTLGFIYFLQTTLGQPHIGLAPDEMDGGMAFMPYHREGRRLQGLVRFNINHMKTPDRYNLYKTGIAVGDYPVDHHHAQYPGKVPPIPFPHVPSFTIPLGTLIPKQVNGLVVCDKSISVSNIINGSTRLQPVVLLTGQAAGVLAALSIQQEQQPRDVSVNAVQDVLIGARCYIMPYLDVSPGQSGWEAIQRIGSWGIIRGVGKSEGWSNKTLFYPDSVMSVQELKTGLEASIPGLVLNLKSKETVLTVPVLIRYINTINRYIHNTSEAAKGVRFIRSYEIKSLEAADWKAMGIQPVAPQQPLTRAVVATVLFHKIVFWNYLEKDHQGTIRLR